MTRRILTIIRRILVRRRNVVVMTYRRQETDLDAKRRELHERLARECGRANPVRMS